MSREAGKGDKRRPTDERKVSEKWDNINWGTQTISTTNPLSTTGFTIKTKQNNEQQNISQSR